MTNEPIIEVIGVQKSFKKGDRQELLVLDDIHFKMYEGEIVAILGKSGSGKSTLLRIIAGLVKPSGGTVHYRGRPVSGPVRGISMVFQTFALLPWLTVLQNVELGLEALGIEREQRRERALKAIDMIGLDGFESALPKELSGGMRQRVGFARALVVNPDILLMDEPFSALDVLTADNLKSDLIDLWQSKQTGLNAILFVTHSIEEAIAIADRIIIFGSNPGSIRSDLKVTLPFPRSDLDPRFRNQVDRVYTLMTTQPQEEKLQQGFIDIGYRLPEASVAEVTGLLEILNSPEHQGKMDLPDVAETLMLDIDDLFPLTELLEILRFAKVSKGDITITEEGKAFVDADILERKKLFSIHLKKFVPLARYIYDQLIRHPRHRALEENYLSLLEDYLSESEAERVLRTVIEWGRYAELFAYDYNSGVLSLENPH
ncbi:ABC transporter ATP-binding protein [Aquicella lusitana]|uniref:NitT/TauT family transport system ATP-binding protein n=1 Tax=Aquicella lusitana TaxID=254246 RepID=A0A370GKI9_9COXI|nr:nitrate/sulfonate/bicarbonate ABC transporter ATP-binding protein [Aquicella lusitana]RDI42453.1 NitT/TauT family transport system ATP-binding protein [Aquicella lusitana]VVC74085.1 Glycine betaine transport ATP-binding protein OpuAA [Aquicella lusitana]